MGLRGRCRRCTLVNSNTSCSLVNPLVFCRQRRAPRSAHSVWPRSLLSERSAWSDGTLSCAICPEEEGGRRERRSERRSSHRAAPLSSHFQARFLPNTCVERRRWVWWINTEESSPPTASFSLNTAITTLLTALRNRRNQRLLTARLRRCGHTARHRDCDAHMAVGAPQQPLCRLLPHHSSSKCHLPHHVLHLFPHDMRSRAKRRECVGVVPANCLKLLLLVLPALRVGLRQLNS